MLASFAGYPQANYQGTPYVMRPSSTNSSCYQPDIPSPYAGAIMSYQAIFNNTDDPLPTQSGVSVAACRRFRFFSGPGCTGSWSSLRPGSVTQEYFKYADTNV